MITEIPSLWHLAHDYLAPTKGGTGGGGSEMSIGINVAALSFVEGSDILRMFHGWESIIREERRLTPPAFIQKPAQLAREIEDACNFAMVHLLWSSEQSWFGDYVDEITAVYETGVIAARKFGEKMRSIPCPADTSEGLPCRNILRIKDGNLSDYFTCKKCNTEWTAIRLMDAALENEGAEIYVDKEAIAHRLGLSVKAVAEFAKRNAIAQRGQLVEMRSFMAARR